MSRKVSEVCSDKLQSLALDGSIVSKVHCAKGEMEVLRKYRYTCTLHCTNFQFNFDNTNSRHLDITVTILITLLLFQSLIFRVYCLKIYNLKASFLAEWPINLL